MPLLLDSRDAPADNVASLEAPPVDTPLRLSTKFAFAVVTMLGGMVVGTGEATGSLPMLLLVFVVIGFVSVDWLQLFSLPSTVAYAAMIFAAIYSISDFAQGGLGTDRKMVAVAELLVIAQSILMLQAKNQRLFEQLLIFAILNCVVAAVFNDAFNYAICLIPLSIASAIALGFLAADTTVDQTIAAGVDADSPTVASLSTEGRRLPWLGILMLSPAIALFAGVFFFGLPRTAQATRGSTSGAAVGFSDALQLNQIGQLLQSTETVMRVSLTRGEDRANYPVVGGLYLRGRVLENYARDRSAGPATAVWQPQPAVAALETGSLSTSFVPQRSGDRNFFDRVNVAVDCEPMRTSSLFAIAPFHWAPGSERVLQLRGRWTMLRRDPPASSLLQRFGAFAYAYGTHAFSNGIQGQWIGARPLTRADDSEPLRSPLAVAASDDSPEPLTLKLTTAPQSAGVDWGRELDYLDALLLYPDDRIPSAKIIADELVTRLPSDKRDPVSIAKRFEQHLSLTGDFQYTLNLDAEERPDVDPIEQFLTVDRKGHCQYFASALAMMLRSQEIPARLVVGYHTEEFNRLGQYFIVRQNHAHAWVEALIDRDDLPATASLYGQEEVDRYWMRLDPTPGGGGVAGAVAGSQMLDMAQNLWDNYIVDLDPDRQKNTLLTTPGLAPMTQSYRSWIDRIQEFATRINAGQVQGFEARRFSFSAALLAMVVLLLALLLFRWPISRGFWRRWRGQPSEPIPRPSLTFYAEALDVIAQQGHHRKSGQTPAEFIRSLDGRVGRRDALKPLQELTDVFYDLRYRVAAQARPATLTDRWQPRIRASLDALRNTLSVKSHQT